MSTRMNLTGLADLANAQLANKGRPLELALDDILPDPDNPRNADDGSSRAAIEAQDELDADIAERGVKTPISVRPHPTIPGKYFINYGHRRYISAQKNQLATIPAFIDEKFDSYDQVNENELRIGLTTRARALFIKGRLDAGDSKSEIAERMRKKNQTFITEHLALIDAPECVNDAYAAGVASARTLYDLRQAWQEFPARIEAWCRSAAHISRDAIKDALAGFRHDEAGSGTESLVRAQPKKFRLDEKVLEVETASATVNGTGGCRGEEESGAEFVESEVASRARVNRKKEADSNEPDRTSMAPRQSPLVEGITVYYNGKLAWIAMDVVVTITLDENDDVLSVPLAELVFER